MSDFIIEILEPAISTVEVETSISDIPVDNIIITYENNNTIDIVNTEKILISDLPYGYSINDTVGDLPASRVSGLLETLTSTNTLISITVKNNNPYALYKGQAVCFTGYDTVGNLPSIELYSANNDLSEQKFIGLVSSYIPQGQIGSVISFGVLSDIDTTGNISNIAIGNETWSNGDILYVSPYDYGKLTKFKPRYNIILVGIILYSNTNGKLLIKSFINPKFDQLNGINISNPINNNLLKYNDSLSEWGNSDQIDCGLI